MRRTTLKDGDLLKLIRQHLPDFAFERAERLQSPGQFNIVLTVDDKWMFRFPKSAGATADLARELEILPRLPGGFPCQFRIRASMPAIPPAANCSSWATRGCPASR